MLVLHGGTSVSTRPTSPAQLAVLRMIPVAAAVGAALRGSDVVVRRHRFAVRGWNGPAASPAADLRRVLDELAGAAHPPAVVLIGHSMGARAALRVADHPLVTAVGGLAPWIPPDEPAVPLPGRQILLVHASADRVTSAADTWAYARQAAESAAVTGIELRGGDHAMLRRGRLWHRLAAGFARLAVGLPAADDQIRRILTGAAGAISETGRPARL
ncbi:MAG TPA: alpha/beta hydrolase [Streptosporangiaceae bacterium]